MGKGIPRAHYQFWDEKGVLGLYQVYLALTVTPEKVLECIEEPLFLDAAEQRVLKYLILCGLYESRSPAIFVVLYWQFSMHQYPNEGHIQWTFWTRAASDSSYM
jgi:hypothetical protein